MYEQNAYSKALPCQGPWTLTGFSSGNNSTQTIKTYILNKKHHTIIELLIRLNDYAKKNILYSLFFLKKSFSSFSDSVAKTPDTISVLGCRIFPGFNE